jgi:hypothetical protein|tara:strand:+ start:139 stop:438 length:300 start_codon:yes stop_codon:yes gene_type:complete
MKISKPQLQQLVQEVIQEGYWKEKEDAYMELKNLMDEYGLGVDDLEALVGQLKLDVGDYPGEGEEEIPPPMSAQDDQAPTESWEDLNEVIKQELSRLLK